MDLKNSLAGKLEKLQKESLLRKPKLFEKMDGRRGTINNAEYLIFCSNDYLGLSHNAEIINAIREGLEKYGAGSGASRMVSGSLAPHSILEEKLKDYLQVEAALLFNSGFSANTGIIPALAGKGDILLCDKLNHASIVDGCRLSGALFRRYPHLNMKSLEKLLSSYPREKTKWIITDGLFSMDGDIAPLPEIMDLAEKYGAYVYLDDAHAFGVLGENGRGVPEMFGLKKMPDVYVATLGKAAGVAGAFVAGSSELIRFLENRARSFIYSTSLPPAVASGGAKSIEILAGCNSMRKSFLKEVSDFNSSLKELEFDTVSKSYIIPIVTGSSGKALKAEQLFWDDKIYIQAIRPPTVPAGTARLRLTLSVNQSKEDRSRVLDLIGKSRHLI